MELKLEALASERANELDSALEGRNFQGGARRQDVLMDSSQFEPRNRLLAALPSRDLRRLRPHLEAVPLALGSVLSRADDPLTRVYFVESGIASLMTILENGATLGVATVGREGAVGVPTVLLGGDTAIGGSQVLIPGSALAAEVLEFRTVLRKSRDLRSLCEAYTRAFFVQVLQAVACSKLHTLEQRCARWLLVCDDQTEDATFALAEGSLAAMLGVPPSAADVTSPLRRAGLIRYHRGAVTVLDRQGLEAATCPCYRIVRDSYERLWASAAA